MVIKFYLYVIVGWVIEYIILEIMYYYENELYELFFRLDLVLSIGFLNICKFMF